MNRIKMARLTLAVCELQGGIEEGCEGECEWKRHTQPDESYDVRPGPSGYFKISAYSI